MVLLLLAACEKSKVQNIEPLGLGERCSSNAGCRAPLACRQGTCQTTATVAVGGACVLSDDCQLGLMCHFGGCKPAGTSAAGGTCGSATDCLRGHWCAFEGFGGTCTIGGAKDLGAACAGTGDCIAGLLCDPIAGTCQTQYSEPVGATCASDAQCLPDLGIICDPEDLRCGGTGPDGLPVPPWEGVSCAATNDLEGEFRAYFELQSGADFFRLPFPNDARIDSNARIDLTGFPQPPPSVVPLDFNDRFVAAIEDELTGFGPNQTVFFRFSGRPLFCGAGCGTGGSCASGCMGVGEPKPTLFVVEIRDDDGNAVSKFSPISHTWVASTGRTPYICWNWLGIMPSATDPWKPGRTYAVLLPAYLRGDGNEVIAQDEDLAAMLQSTSPGGDLDHAWQAHAPLRDWLALAPKFPHDGSFIDADDLAVAAVFTIRDPKSTLAALATAVGAAPLVEFSDYDVCAAGSSTCSDPVTSAFVEVQGRVAMPSYQQGTAPYEKSGGGIVMDGGAAEQQGNVSVRFSLSIPKGTPEAGGWPLVIYAHGTGGDYRSYLDEGIAQQLAETSFDGDSVSFAVLSWDAVAHGERRGTSQVDAELLYFNLANPVAAKGNGLQAMTELLAVSRSISALSDDLAQLGQLTALTSVDVALDDTALAFFGHSQGASSGVPALPYAQNIELAVLSGAGAGLIDVLGAKQSPFDLAALLHLVLGDPSFDAPREQPVLNLVQEYLEEVDPINYAHHITANVLEGGSTKHVLQILGAGDTYTPNLAGLNLAERLGAQYLDDDDSDLVAAEDVVAAPVKGSPTRVTSIHVPIPPADGHFVAFDDASAQERIAAFLASWWVDGNRTPTVVP